MNKETDTEAAKNILEKAKVKRREECLKEIKQVLQKYRCTLEPSVTILGQRISGTVNVIDLPDE